MDIDKVRFGYTTAKLPEGLCTCGHAEWLHEGGISNIRQQSYDGKCNSRLCICTRFERAKKETKQNE